MMDVWQRHQTDRAVGPDSLISEEPETEEIIEYSEEEKEEKEDVVEEIVEAEEPLTPPRSCINVAPDPAPPLDWNLWRRRYPSTPPSASCSESLIVQVEPVVHESSSSTTTAYSSSDATGISSSIATTTTTTEASSSSVFIYLFPLIY